MAIDKSVADTILLQMGGMGRLRTMTGAKNFVALDGGLQFDIPQAKQIRKVKIALRCDDTYDMLFYKVVKGVVSLKCCHGGDCNQLQKIFTEVTGLETHL